MSSKPTARGIDPSPSNRAGRRDFLQKAASALAAAGLGATAKTGLLASTTEPHLEFPTEPRARLAVSSYPFRDLVDSPFLRKRNPQHPGMDLPAFAKIVVDRFRVPGIEIWSPHIQSRSPADLAALRDGIGKAGAHVVNIAADVRQSLYDPDPEKRRMAIDAGKQWVDTAGALGCPSIRVHIAGVGGVAPDVARAASSLTELAEYGAGRNVIINLENDDLFSEDAFFIVRVIDHAHHPYLRALPDFGNSAMTGDPAFNEDAMILMFRHAYNISHMKDSEADDNGKIITADVPSIFEIARAAGYRGYFSMEMDRPGDPYEGTAQLIELSLHSLGGH